MAHARSPHRRHHRGAPRPGGLLARLVLVGCLVAAPVLVACGAADDGSAGAPADDSSAATAGPASPSSPSSGSSGSSGAATSPGETLGAWAADPEHAVDRPAPLEAALVAADLLVTTSQPLDAAAVARVRAVPGVRLVERVSRAQALVEDRTLDLLAVDPARYRRFTPAASAQSQVVWNRVAGGEIAVRPALRRRLPADDEGWLRLGNRTDSPRVHVGAYAPQVAGVDAVVNEAWVDDLEMTRGNALLVAVAPRTSPQSVRRAVTRAAGSDAAVEILGPDLPVGAAQTAVVVGTVGEAVGRFTYTVLGGGRIAPDPAWVAAHIRTETVPILGSVTCNNAIFPQLRAALTEIVDLGLASEIHPGEYAGCYYPRFIAGTTSLSNHSFGLALDLNVPGNQRGTVGEMDRTVVAVFEKWGFTWGGDWAFTDPMHFEMNRVVNPG
ncbi:M15 family metallopeptidase [Nocardioides bruguierae]|uniref:M15 family metallopeptidase n=1 Tax=Nocardioides bruguierae TaxID=2945102 RepID=A0A9X2IEP4_9ACTN|nr:M15 family metallopeptidase [Nocardioides bruguierae]MCM0621036.1 M15 family metallopeptidase [Nocardioides bruguierae]